MAMSSPTVQLFDGRAERVNLLLPIVFLLLVLATGRGQLTPTQFQWATWLSATVGMNAIHNVFSLSFFALPEFRSWVKAQNSRNGKNLLLAWGIVMFLILLYFQVEAYLFEWPGNAFGRNFSWLMTFLKVCVAVRIGYSFHHSVAQNAGFSLLYNKKYLASEWADEAGCQRVQRMERIERFLLRAYALSVSLVVGAIVFGSVPRGGLRYGIVCVFVVLAGAINGVAYWYPGRPFRGKRIYLLRLFLAPLFLVTQMGVVGYYFMHGIESLVFFRHITRRSTLTNRSNFLYLTWAMCLGALALTILRPGHLGLQSVLLRVEPSLAEARWLFILGAFSMAVSYMHYYLEGQIYHFSDPITREHFGPLVLGPAKSRS